MSSILPYELMIAILNYVEDLSTLINVVIAYPMSPEAELGFPLDYYVGRCLPLSWPRQLRQYAYLILLAQKLDLPAFKALTYIGDLHTGTVIPFLLRRKSKKTLRDFWDLVEIINFILSFCTKKIAGRIGRKFVLSDSEEYRMRRALLRFQLYAVLTHQPNTQAGQIDQSLDLEIGPYKKCFWHALPLNEIEEVKTVYVILYHDLPIDRPELLDCCYHSAWQPPYHYNTTCWTNDTPKNPVTDKAIAIRHLKKAYSSSSSSITPSCRNKDSITRNPRQRGLPLFYEFLRTSLSDSDTPSQQPSNLAQTYTQKFFLNAPMGLLVKEMHQLGKRRDLRILPPYQSLCGEGLTNHGRRRKWAEGRVSSERLILGDPVNMVNRQNREIRGRSRLLGMVFWDRGRREEWQNCGDSLSLERFCTTRAG